MIRRSLWMIFAVACWAACGGGSPTDPGAGGAGGSGAGGDGGADEQDPLRDTSMYEGRLAWTRGSDSGVFVWDLPKSRWAYRHLPEAEGVERSCCPALAANGSVLAYSYGTGFRFDEEDFVRIVNLETGLIESYPSPDFTSHPSLSADGRRVAVRVENEGWRSHIEVWDRDEDRRIRVSDSSSRMLHLSEDGTRILFATNHGSVPALAIAEVVEGAEPKFIHLLDHPDIRHPNNPDRLRVSSDLRWVVFRHYVVDGTNAPFLLDTSTGTIQRLSPELPLTGNDDNYEVFWSAVAISGDGSTLAFSASVWHPTDPISYVLTAPRDDPTNATVIRTGPEPFGDVALSADGTIVAYAEALFSLWVSRIDGTDPRLFAEPGDGVVIFGQSLTF